MATKTARECYERKIFPEGIITMNTLSYGVRMEHEDGHMTNYSWDDEVEMGIAMTTCPHCGAEVRTRDTHWRAYHVAEGGQWECPRASTASKKTTEEKA